MALPEAAGTGEGVSLSPEKAAHAFHGTMEPLGLATPDVVRRRVEARRGRCPSIGRDFTRPNPSLRPRCRPRSGCPP